MFSESFNTSLIAEICKQEKHPCLAVCQQFPWSGFFNLLSSSVSLLRFSRGMEESIKGLSRGYSQLFVHQIPGSFRCPKECPNIWMMLIDHPYLFNTPSVSGLTPVRLRKAVASLKTCKRFLREQLLIIVLSWISFSCLLALNVGIEHSFRSLTNTNQAAQYTAPQLFGYFTCLL